MPDGNPLVAQAPQDGNGPGPLTAGNGDYGYAGGIGIAESAIDSFNGIKDGDWVGGGLGVLSLAGEAASAAIDPFGYLLSSVASFLMEHIQPLKDMLDSLAGDPPVIQSYSETWANVAKSLEDSQVTYANAVKNGTAGWTGSAADAYRKQATEQADALAGAATAASTISTVVMIMGEVVAFVREFVRDLIADLIGKLIAWVLETVFSLGFGTPVVVAQAVTAISAWAVRIADKLKELLEAIRRVSPLLGKLGDVFAKILKVLGKIAGKVTGLDVISTKSIKGSGFATRGGGGGGSGGSSGGGTDGPDGDGGSGSGSGDGGSGSGSGDSGSGSGSGDSGSGSGGGDSGSGNGSGDGSPSSSDTPSSTRTDTGGGDSPSSGSPSNARDGNGSPSRSGDSSSPAGDGGSPSSAGDSSPSPARSDSPSRTSDGGSPSHAGDSSPSPARSADAPSSARSADSPTHAGDSTPSHGGDSPSHAGDSSPSPARGDGSPSPARSADSPSHAGDSSPSPTRGDSPSHAGDNSPSSARSDSPSHAGDSSPSPARSADSPSHAGDSSPSRGGDSPSHAGNGSPSHAGDSSPSPARAADAPSHSGSPSHAGDGSPRSDSGTPSRPADSTTSASGLAPSPTPRTDPGSMPSQRGGGGDGSPSSLPPQGQPMAGGMPPGGAPGGAPGGSPGGRPPGGGWTGTPGSPGAPTPRTPDVPGPRTPDTHAPRTPDPVARGPQAPSHTAPGTHGPGNRPGGTGPGHTGPGGHSPDGNGPGGPHRDTPDGGSHSDPDGSQHHDQPERLTPDEVNRRHSESTPSGSSYHRADADMGDLPHRVQPDPDGRYTVDVHVTPDGHARIGNQRYTPEEFADILRRNGDYDGRPIRLIGCDAGSNDFAKRLSRELDTEVMAPSKPAWTDSNGRVFSSDYEVGPDGKMRPKIPPNGEWDVHSPDGTSHRASDDGFTPDTHDADKHDLDADDAAARGDGDQPTQPEYDEVPKPRAYRPDEPEFDRRFVNWDRPADSEFAGPRSRDGHPDIDSPRDLDEAPARTRNSKLGDDEVPQILRGERPLAGNTQYNVSYENGATTRFFTDANGNVTHVEATPGTQKPFHNPDLRHPLLPDTQYRVPNFHDPSKHWDFHIGANGKPDAMTGDPSFRGQDETYRDNASQLRSGGEGKKAFADHPEFGPEYDHVRWAGGHLAANEMGGPGEYVNMHPQMAASNSGNYRDGWIHEASWRRQEESLRDFQAVDGHEIENYQVEMRGESNGVPENVVMRWQQVEYELDADGNRTYDADGNVREKRITYEREFPNNPSEANYGPKTPYGSNE